MDCVRGNLNPINSENGSRYVITVASNPTIVPTCAPKGAIGIFVTGASVYQKQDDGLSTNWSLLGSLDANSLRHQENALPESVTLHGSAAYQTRLGGQIVGQPTEPVTAGYSSVTLNSANDSGVGYSLFPANMKIFGEEMIIVNYFCLTSANAGSGNQFSMLLRTHQVKSGEVFDNIIQTDKFIIIPGVNTPVGSGGGNELPPFNNQLITTTHTVPGGLTFDVPPFQGFRFEMWRASGSDPTVDTSSEQLQWVGASILWLPNIFPKP